MAGRPAEDPVKGSPCQRPAGRRRILSYGKAQLNGPSPARGGKQRKRQTLASWYKIGARPVSVSPPAARRRRHATQSSPPTGEIPSRWTAPSPPPPSSSAPSRAPRSRTSRWLRSTMSSARTRRRRSPSSSRRSPSSSTRRSPSSSTRRSPSWTR